MLQKPSPPSFHSGVTAPKALKEGWRRGELNPCSSRPLFTVVQQRFQEGYRYMHGFSWTSLDVPTIVPIWPASLNVRHLSFG